MHFYQRKIDPVKRCDVKACYFLAIHSHKAKRALIYLRNYLAFKPFFHVLYPADDLLTILIDYLESKANGIIDRRFIKGYFVAKTDGVDPVDFAIEDWLKEKERNLFKGNNKTVIFQVSSGFLEYFV